MLIKPGPFNRGKGQEDGDMMQLLHLNLDGAWQDGELSLPMRDLRPWGPRLRYCAPETEVEAFDKSLGEELPPFILYGSGDFHYLAALWVRRAARPARERTSRGQFTVVSFDNHPDWDIRPPRWACGGWICRALEIPGLHASVWGCGNFELAWPARLFANRAALADGRLTVYAWAERQKPAVRRRFDCMSRSGWRQRFDRFVTGLAGGDVYVTVDLDCLRADQAVTNWENGLFTAEDVAWAIGSIRNSARVVGGDLCGAWSRPAYARWRQRFAGNWDHPKLPEPNEAHARSVNSAALAKIWPALTG
jgi:hypothetical protein